MLLTNTFGACRIMLDRHGEGARTVAASTARPWRIAREASAAAATCSATSAPSAA